MSKLNYGMTCDCMDFVSYKIAEKGIKGYIYVFTRQRNGKIRKKKVDCVGYITKHPITKRYAFFPNDDWCFSAKNMLIIGSFIDQLGRKIISFNANTGEIKKL